MDKGKNIELRTDEVRDILQKMPHWTIRWGITIIFGAVVLLLVFTYLFRYPDLIRSEVVISASNPPAELKARTTGKITSLQVSDGQSVSIGQVLAIIENPANSRDVEQLIQQIEQIAPFVLSFEKSDYILFDGQFELGEIQSYYADFTHKVKNYLVFSDQQLYAENIKAAGQQLNMQEVYYDRLWLQRKMMEEELELSKRSFRRDSQLYQTGVISISDYEGLKKELIGQQLEFEKIRTQLAVTQSGIHELEQQLLMLKINLDEKENQLKLDVVKAYELLKNSVDSWQVAYQLASPIAGKLSMDKVWAVNQNVVQGETVMTIVPDGPFDLKGKAYISTSGAGKVKPGQRVNIKLNNYPYMEFGMLIGKVKTIAPVPVNNFYAIDIEMPEKLTTNYGNALAMQQELWGNCEIITEDLRLIQRIVYPIKAVVERNRR